METFWSFFLYLKGSSPDHTPLGPYHILPSGIILFLTDLLS